MTHIPKQSPFEALPEGVEITGSTAGKLDALQASVTPTQAPIEASSLLAPEAVNAPVMSNIATTGIQIAGLLGAGFLTYLGIKTMFTQKMPWKQKESLT